MSSDNTSVPPERMSRASESYLTFRRHELLAPINAIIEGTNILLDVEKVTACARYREHLQTIKIHAEEMVAVIQELMGPRRPAAQSFSPSDRHAIRNLLTVIMTHGEDLCRNAKQFYLDAWAPDFEQVFRMAMRSISICDEIAAHLEGDGPVKTEDRFYRLFSDAFEHIPKSYDSPIDEPGHILVVDDNPVIREDLEGRLGRRGHKVTAAESGDIALAILQARGEQFDLILLDVIMPGTNGFQVLGRIKADQRLRHIPVIMVSGLGEFGGIIRCIEIGAEDYLTKPFDPVFLRARVDACLEKKRLRDRNEEERRRYDELLHDILPAEIVKTLKRHRVVRPTRHEGVAVLFADIVGFTPYCDANPPEKVVALLEQLFVQWEEIAQNCHVQKIKTIGDAFMACAGLPPQSSENPVRDCVECGFEMIKVTRRLRNGWDLRVGVHAGAVVAGVLGRRQYLYDLWGDTVNTAARLESHGKPGCVNLWGDGWGRVSHIYKNVQETSRLVKGKESEGPMKIIHLDPTSVGKCGRV
jgi:class 3 adenylate cyclase